MGFVRDNIETAARQLKNIARSYRQEPKAVTVEPSLVADPQRPKDWTVLAYMEGRDRLSNSVEVALNGMEQIGSTEYVNLVTQATMVPEVGDRRFQQMGEVNTRRYYVTQDADDKTVTSPVVTEFDEQKRLDASSLEDFWVWGMQNFPAKHYMFVVKKHGLGFAANGETVAVSAREMRQVLENVEKRTGVKPEVLVWDSCNMGQLEVAYELKDRAKVMTGSPEAIPAVEFPYPTLLHNLTRFPKEQTAQTLGQTVVMSYEAEAPRTIQTALALDKLPQLSASMRGLVSSVLDGGVSKDLLYTNLMKSASFEPTETSSLAYSYRDVAGFLGNLASDEKLPARVRQAAGQAAKDLAETQLAHHLHPATAHLKNLGDKATVSAFLPWRDPSEKLMQGYGELAWSKDTGWDQLLEYILGDAKAVLDAEASHAPLRSGLGKLALYGYKKFVSPYHLSGCPYDTTCSQYAREALEQKGWVEGGKMAFMRVLSCQEGAGGKDEVGEHRHHHEAPLPEVVLRAPAVAHKSSARQRAERVLFKAARGGGRMVGGTLAALVGAPVGAALGGLWGAKAGAGTLKGFNQELRGKYGDHKTDCLERVQQPLVEPGVSVQEAVTRLTGSATMGKVAGSVAGALAGASLGLLGGAVFSYRYFGSFAGLGLQNLAKDSLGELPAHYGTERILRRDYTEGATPGKPAPCGHGDHAHCH